MHIVYREKRNIEESAIPTDLNQSPADIIVLSFSDSDLTAFSEGWERANKYSKGKFPNLRLANLQDLKHPLSVDTYIEKTLSRAKAVIIRLIGGVPYWEYGLNQVKKISKEKNIALAVLPADGREDKKLASYSNIPESTLKILNDFCNTGGSIATHAALAQISLTAGIYSSKVVGEKFMPIFGYWSPKKGIYSKIDPKELKRNSFVLITFYRSFITASDLNPIKVLINTLEKNNLPVVAIFIPSLKEPKSSKWIQKEIKNIRPLAIINATSFSSKIKDGSSPLDFEDVPVFQVSLSTNKRKSWIKENRGLSPTDMIMHVALPEIDGRLFAGVASFKERLKKNNKLEFFPIKHIANKERIEAIVKKVNGWIKLKKISNSKKKIAFIVSTYPGKPWFIGHAVGLDVFKSVESIMQDIGILDEKEKINFIKEMESNKIYISIDDYKNFLSTINKKLVKSINKVWGSPEKDKDFIDGKFLLKAFYYKNCLIALQPERGDIIDREHQYHDLDSVPKHSYVAFYFWIKHKFKTDVIIHVGAHGTLEWLPGKSVGLSKTCWPEILTDNTPVIYPFIINDPGESSQAKRRINALTIGHIPPRLKRAGKIKKLSYLETLLDEFSNADGLDPDRRERLKIKIREESKKLGLDNDLSIREKDNNDLTLTKIDKFVCDIKDSQFGSGLHIFGRISDKKYSFDIKKSIKKEKENIIKSISGCRIEPGPSGSPFKGRLDVLPSGRNLYSNDPSSIPSKAAYEQGSKLASEFLKRHLQDKGDHARTLLIDLWGSATMRTAGEEFSMALCLMGVSPTWVDSSDKVSGIEIITIPELNRPRVDVTLRISGLFRDIFPSLTQLYDQVINVLSKRYEYPEDNPFVNNTDIARIYGPKSGNYGLRMSSNIKEYTEDNRENYGEDWIESSAWSIVGNKSTYNRKGIENRIKEIESYVHVQDLKETDILLSSDYAKHQGGFIAAKNKIGGNLDAYNMDNTENNKSRIRSLKEELARVIYARASNTRWIKSMFKHRHRGASEIANTFENICMYAHLTDNISDQLLDLFFEATFGDQEVLSFIKQNNLEAYESMKSNFKKIHESGIWVSQRNSVIEKLYGSSEN